MDPIEEIARAQSTDLVDEDGTPVQLAPAPGLSEAEIEDLQTGLGVRLPHELRALLAHTSGIDGVLDAVDFTGRGLAGFEAPDIFPAAHTIAHDGFGNHWVVDVTPADRDVAPVFFACHDAPVILFQGPSVGHFLHEVFRMYVPPHASRVDDVHEDRLFNVWGENPGVIERAAALESGDEALRSFAAELDDRFAFVDLRDAPVGMGFSWGRYGPRTEVRRHGHERIFAYARPEKRPGVLRRLLRGR